MCVHVCANACVGVGVHKHVRASSYVQAHVHVQQLVGGDYIDRYSYQHCSAGVPAGEAPSSGPCVKLAHCLFVLSLPFVCGSFFLFAILPTEHGWLFRGPIFLLGQSQNKLAHILRYFIHFVSGTRNAEPRARFGAGEIDVDVHSSSSSSSSSRSILHHDV